MELHLESNTIECLAGTGSEGRIGAKGLQLIAALRSRAGPELWVGYSGHLHLAICTADPYSLALDRKIVQILVDLRQPKMGFDVECVLPIERRPWCSIKGYAATIEEAVVLVLLAADACERRPEHLAKLGM